MSIPSRVALVCGLLGLLLSVINQLSAPQLEPALLRSSALAALLSVGLLLVAALWTRVLPSQAARATLIGTEGLLLRRDLPAALQSELNWGSQTLLQATAAAVVVVLWNNAVLLRRGLCHPDGPELGFATGPICNQAMARGRSIHLVDLKHYPGRDEFSQLLADLPSVLVQPLAQQGLLLIGGWSPRCFSSADQRWIEAWAARLTDELQTGSADAWAEPAAAPGSTEPVSPEH
ncbi:MAG: cofactor assembly of complex C subunit B [Cyanobacteriota bacterium]|nr:cofactor assembly of complex C subunit B [Cyanobacteriota bacterium]